METYISIGQVLFSRRHSELLDQLKYFPRGDHDDGPDALEMALRVAELSGILFEDLSTKRDRHGRDINDPDYERTTPERTRLTRMISRMGRTILLVGED